MSYISIFFRMYYYLFSCLFWFGRTIILIFSLSRGDSNRFSSSTHRGNINYDKKYLRCTKNKQFYNDQADTSNPCQGSPDRTGQLRPRTDQLWPAGPRFKVNRPVE